MSYKIVINKRNGRKMCYKDGVLIKEKDIPEELLNATTTSTTTTLPPERKVCIFDGMPFEHQRMVWHENKQVVVYLCGGCYFTKTLGEIKGRLNKK